MDEGHPAIEARIGDWLEAHGVHGHGVRRGQIVDILGEPDHQHFQVRWNENHESMIFPHDILRIIPATSN